MGPTSVLVLALAALMVLSLQCEAFLPPALLIQKMLKKPSTVVLMQADLQKTLVNHVAEMAKATVASADAVGVESMGLMKKISAAVSQSSATVSQSSTAAGQTKVVAVEASSKADAANVAAFKASIDELNVNILALHAQQEKSDKMAQLRWAYDHVEDYRSDLSKGFISSLYSELKPILSTFMAGNGVYIDQVVTNSTGFKNDLSPSSSTGRGEAKNNNYGVSPKDQMTLVQDTLEKLLGKRPTIETAANGRDVLVY